MLHTDPPNVVFSRQFRGLAGNPALAQAIQQSFANQTYATTAVLQTVDNYNLGQ